MNITYGELKETIGELVKKHGLPETRLEELDDVIEETDETALELLKIEFVTGIEDILTMTTIQQISGKDYCDEGKYNIDIRTELSKESIFQIYSHIHQTLKEQLYVEIAYSFISDEEADILDTLLEAYSMNGDEEVKIYTESRNLINKFPKKSFMHKLVGAILKGENLFNAMEKLFIENGVNPNDKKVIENADTPKEIKEFLYDFNRLLLSKLGITNGHIIEKDTGFKILH